MQCLALFLGGKRGRGRLEVEGGREAGEIPWGLNRNHTHIHLHT